MADEENRCEVAMPLQLAREITRQGEARLMALMSLGTAADLRATTLCGIFGASGVAFGAAVLTSMVTGHPVPAVIVGGGVVSFGLLLAAGIAAHAAAPRDFYIAGGNPNLLREWSWDAGRWRSESEMLDATAARYARSIEENRKILDIESRAVKAALWVAGAAPIIGTVAFLVSASL
jgi:hypothetical protein